jgi:L-asparagine transporter-like permease
MIRSASKVLKSNLDGAGLSKKFLTAIKYLKNAAKVLTIIAVILDGILLIYEAIVGDQQRTALQECVSSSFFKNMTLTLYMFPGLSSNSVLVDLTFRS